MGLIRVIPKGHGMLARLRGCLDDSGNLDSKQISEVSPRENQTKSSLPYTLLSPENSAAFCRDAAETVASRMKRERERGGGKGVKEVGGASGSGKEEGKDTRALLGGYSAARGWGSLRVRGLALLA